MKEGLGERLSLLLQEKNITQKELAEKANVTESAISHYVKGDRTPRVAVLNRIAEALEISIEDLMQEKSEDSNGEIRYAIRLLGRNASQMSEEDKMKIARILISKAGDIQ